MSGPDSALLPLRFFRLFLNTLTSELGPETLASTLARADLPVDLVDPQTMSGYTSQSAAITYARIQKAMRVYYGRGARGALTRIGRLMWTRALESASISDRAQAQFIRTLPPGMRRKAALELLARFMREKPANVSIHSLDLDLMMVDHASAAAFGQQETAPVCYVSLGLIQENLFWATAREHDVDEISCCASGGHACEFRIKLEGKQ
jgi:predicted hydrocarbon binding protein